MNQTKLNDQLQSEVEPLGFTVDERYDNKLKLLGPANHDGTIYAIVSKYGYRLMSSYQYGVGNSKEYCFVTGGRTN